MSFRPTVNREYGDWLAPSLSELELSAAESRTSATSGLEPRVVTDVEGETSARTIISAHA